MLAFIRQVFLGSILYTHTYILLNSELYLRLPFILFNFWMLAYSMRSTHTTQFTGLSMTLPIFRVLFSLSLSFSSCSVYSPPLAIMSHLFSFRFFRLVFSILIPKTVIKMNIGKKCAHARTQQKNDTQKANETFFGICLAEERKNQQKQQTCGRVKCCVFFSFIKVYSLPKTT